MSAPMTPDREQVRVELMAEFVAWLVKKAREHRAQGPQYAKQADVIGLLASKVQRGAVRPNNLLMLPAQGGPEDDVLAAQVAAHGPFPMPAGDPLAYGPTGVRCGCGKDAHSNLVPCAPDPAAEVSRLSDELTGCNLSLYEEELDNARLRLALASAQRGRRELRARVAELETFAQGCDGEGCVFPHSSWCERAKEQAAENGGCTCPRGWPGGPHPHASYCWLVSPPRNEVDEMRKRIAELEALKPARFQECQKCGAGYEYGQPCTVCEYEETVAAYLATPYTDDTPRDLPPGAEAPRHPGACLTCGDIPDEWCPDCAACRTGCQNGHVDNPCTHPNAPWRVTP